MVYNKGRSIQAKEDSIICNGQRKWRGPRNRVTRSTMSHSPNLQTEIYKEDSIEWLLYASGVFTVKSAWHAIRH